MKQNYNYEISLQQTVVEEPNTTLKKIAYNFTKMIFNRLCINMQVYVYKGTKCDIDINNDKILVQDIPVLKMSKIDYCFININKAESEYCIKIKCLNNGNVELVGGLIHDQLRGLPEYINSDIVLNMDTDQKEVNIYFTKDIKLMPELFLLPNSSIDWIIRKNNLKE